MREIKFRAWDGRQMLDDVTPWGEDTIISVDEYESRDSSVNAIMQFTGLKDKNGVEIYEGDIVKRKPAETRYPELQPDLYIGHVYFDNYKAQFRIETPMEFSIKEPNAYTNMQDFKMNGGKIWEVIGNIYENPELLK